MQKNIKINKKKILILINNTSKVFNRSYSNNALFMGKKLDCELIRDQFLEKLGLSDLRLVWPENTSSTQPVDYIKKNPNSLSQMYGDSDLSKLPIFQGGFINFGYWPNAFLENEKITTEQRIACSKEMYRVVGDLAGILKQHSILDIGCGLGYGSSFFLQQYQPKLVVGLDISSEQIARAKKYHATEICAGKLRFTIGEAESMPFTEGAFDCVLSVEAAQHFTSISAFSKEASRILKPGGQLVITSFFPTNKEGVEALNAIIPNYHIHGSQNTIMDIKKEISENMENVKVKSIGKNVWHGLSKWLDQIGYHNQWSKIWGALYEKNLIDYVIYEATSPIVNDQSLEPKNNSYRSSL